MRRSLGTVLWPRFSRMASNSQKCFASGILGAPRKFLRIFQLFLKTFERACA